MLSCLLTTASSYIHLLHQEVHESQRADVANSLVYEANLGWAWYIKQLSINFIHTYNKALVFTFSWYSNFIKIHRIPSLALSTFRTFYLFLLIEVTYPLDVLRLRLAVQSGHSTLSQVTTSRTLWRSCSWALWRRAREPARWRAAPRSPRPSTPLLLVDPARTARGQRANRESS
jgi:hypothetical protein